jgi:hypothetical protein
MYSLTLLKDSSDKMKKAIKGMKVWTVILIPAILNVFWMGFKGEALQDE